MIPEIATDRDGLQALLDALIEGGFDVLGPRVYDGTIVTAPLSSVASLPTGFTVDQAPGRATLRATGTTSAFAWASPPQAWKPILHPPHTTVSIHDGDGDGTGGIQPDGTSTVPVESPARSHPVALFGLRPCDVAAIERLDRVLVECPARPEPMYAHRRAAVLTIVVNCGHPASTCFCASTATGPHVDRRRPGAVDIEITELDAVDDEPVTYLIDGHSERGAELVDTIPAELRRPADGRDAHRRRRQRRHARTHQQRRLPDTRMLRSLHGLRQGPPEDDPAWTDVAERCLACGNCTAVCPTCFCTAIDDTTDLGGDQVVRDRRWDSCFSLEFTRLGSSIVRSSVASRYRQWLVHKLDTWHDQFGESGCVGCGRCITWCPAAIDLVAEATRLTAVSSSAIAATEPATAPLEEVTR